MTQRGGSIAKKSQTAPYISSSLVAEGLAMREAILHTKELGGKKVRVESDSCQMINVLLSRAFFSDLHGIISNIMLCLPFFFIMCRLSISLEKRTWKYMRYQNRLLAW